MARNFYLDSLKKKHQKKKKKRNQPQTIPKSSWYFVESDSLMETIQNTHLSQLYISPALSHLQEMLMEKLPKRWENGEEKKKPTKHPSQKGD